MKVKFLLGMFAILMWCNAFAADDFDMEGFAANYLKEHGQEESEPAKADPASGFWICDGARIHMSVAMDSWDNLDTGSTFTLEEKPSPIASNDEFDPGGGTSYIYSWDDNPAVLFYFAVDKTGKNLYVHDNDHYEKRYRCKRTK